MTRGVSTPSYPAPGWRTWLSRCIEAILLTGGSLNLIADADWPVWISLVLMAIAGSLLVRRVLQT